MASLGSKVQGGYVAALTPAGLGLTVVLQVAALLAFSWFGPGPEVGDGSDIGLIWQVHAAFASIGFAGLAIAFQVLGDPPLSAGSARHAVVSDMRFGQLLTSGVAASVVIGVATLWLASPGTIAVSFLVVLVPSVLIVAAAYARLAILFTSSQRIEELTLEVLNQRLRSAARKAAAQEQAKLEAERDIDSARGLLSGSLASTSGLETRRIRNPYYRATVISLDVGPMVFAADHLAWEAHEASSRRGLQTYTYDERISVRARPGRQYRLGDTLFEMLDWPGVDDATWEAISRQLLSGLRFGTDQSGDAAVVFAEDMSALQDSVLAAVRDHQIARVERGYFYYHQTIHEARASTGTTHLGLKDPRWFERQIAEIDDAAARSTDRTAFVAIGDAERMAYDAVKTQDLPWLRLSLTRLQRIWSVLLTSDRAHAVHARENVLVSMQNLAEFAVPYSFAGPEEFAYASRHLIWAFTAIAKTAIDVGDAATAQRVLGYMGGLYDLSERDVSESRGVEIAVGQAALLAWVLRAADRRDRSAPPVPVRLDWFPRRHYPPDAILVLRAYESHRDEAPWRFWESEGALPFQTHVSKFGGYFRRAVLLLAADQKLRLRASTVVADDRYLLEETRSARDEVQSHWEANSDDWSGLESVVATLTQLIDALDDRRRRDLASTPFSSTRVQDFHDAIIETMGSAPRLATFLGVTPVVGQPDDLDGGLLGQILKGIPREFFVESDVIASPSHLGHQIGAAVLRGQDFGVLRVLLGDQKPTQVTSDVLLRDLRALAEALRDPVVVYNGQSEVEETLGIDFTASGTVTLAGYPAFAMYVSDLDFPCDVVLVDRENLSKFDFLPEDKESLTVLPDTGLAVGIAEAGEDDQGNPMLAIEYGQVARWSRGTPGVVPISVVP